MKKVFKALFCFILIYIAAVLFVGCTHSDVQGECAHSYYYVDLLEATCTSDGVAGHFACEKCDKLFDFAKREISINDIILSKLGHDFADGEISFIPTCESEGEKIFFCTRCDETKTETLPKTPHDYSLLVSEEQTHSYICSVCNAVNQQSVAPHEFSDYVCAEESGHYATCEICGYEVLSEHQFVDNICIDCGYAEETEAPGGPQLEYQKAEDGSYKVVGLGTFVGTDIVIPATWRNRPVTEISANAFLNSNVKSIHIAASVTKIEGAILGMQKLETITIDTENPTFYVKNNCVLERATNKLICGTNTDVIPTEAVSIERYAFYMNKLSQITIPKNVKHIGFKAFYQTGLTKVTIEDGVEIFDNSVFQNCSELIEINLPDSLTDVGEYTFSGCKNLKNLVLPANITEIGSSFLYMCDNLESLTLNAKLEKIGSFALSGLASLKQLVIPSAVTEISKYAFFSTNGVRIIFESPYGWRAGSEDIEFDDPDFNYLLLGQYYDCVITKNK